MYRRILVATGGSVWSDAAVASATALAIRTGAILRIVSVLSAPTTSAKPDPTWLRDDLMAEIEHTGHVIATQAAAQAASAGVAYEVSCPWGHVAESILRAAVDCDLIVLGSRGVAGWKRLMAGDVTNAVAAKAIQPVVVVKPVRLPTAPLRRRLLVAIGGSPWSFAALDYALWLAQAQDLELCVLHVAQASPWRGEDPAVAEGKNLLTLAEARAAMDGIAYEGILASEPILDAILDTATVRQCDTILLGTRGVTGRKRLRIGNIANAVTVKAPQPVLIVKHFFDAERSRWRRRHF